MNTNMNTNMNTDMNTDMNTNKKRYILEFIGNALRNGWKIKQVGDYQYIFVKKQTFGILQFDVQQYLEDFVIENLSSTYCK